MAFRRPHPVPLLAGIVVALLTLQLGNWQVRRAAEKNTLQADYASESRSAPQALGTEPPAEWQTVSLRGTWDARRTILIDNRVHAHRAGFHVFTPLRIEGQGGWVLVNRGWIAAGVVRDDVPAVATPAGVVEVTGRVRYPDPRAFTLGSDGAAPAGVIWQTLEPVRYRAWAGIPVADFYLQQSSAASDSLVREWPAPDAGVDRHRGYAFQWYALAALAAALTVRYLWQSMAFTTRRGHGWRDSH